MNVLMWFTNDLRVSDQPALALAAASGRVLPLYLVDPQLWAMRGASGRQWEFLAECLEGLRSDLADLGAPLVVRVGDPVTVLERLCRQHDIARIISSADPGGDCPDPRVAAWARANAIEWLRVPPGDTAARGDAERSTGLTPVANIAPGVIPPARALRLAEDRCRHRQTGGRGQAEALLESFLQRRAAGYRAAQTAPLLAERAGSRLSPYLAHGVMGRAELATAVAARRAERPGAALSTGLGGFTAALTRRDAPAVTSSDRGPLPARADHGTLALRRAWAAGETGVPFVDASLRYLDATGWLPEKLRLMLAGFACQVLGLDQQAAGTPLAQRFTDYAPQLFWPAMAEAAVSALTDPVAMGQRHDPQGTFTRRWLPELAMVPHDLLQCPWRWSGAAGLLGSRYPEPVIDLRASLQSARDAQRLAQSQSCPRYAQRPWPPAPAQLRLQF